MMHNISGGGESDFKLDCYQMVHLKREIAILKANEGYLIDKVKSMKQGEIMARG